MAQHRQYFAHTDLTKAIIPANMASSQLKDAFVKGTRFKADEFRAIADNWSQRREERPDAKLPRACADRARQLHAGLP
jgi:hypothetical protein